MKRPPNAPPVSTSDRPPREPPHDGPPPGDDPPTIDYLVGLVREIRAMVEELLADERA